jgi:phage shock protein PspC (stress-responsive transcriptional regulator)
MTRALVRSEENKVIAGVCGGIAERFGWDPTLVRILYVLISVLSAAFPGILVYIVLWIVMPKREEYGAARP